MTIKTCSCNQAITTKNLKNIQRADYSESCIGYSKYLQFDCPKCGTTLSFTKKDKLYFYLKSFGVEKRQIEVCKKAYEGVSLNRIATYFNIEKKTVVNCMTKIRKKTGFTSDRMIFYNIRNHLNGN